MKKAAKIKSILKTSQFIAIMERCDELNLEQPNDPILKADGFDEALLGIVKLRNSQYHALAYSSAKILEILIKRDGMEYEEALEHFDFNIAGAFVGEGTPVFVEDQV